MTTKISHFKNNRGFTLTEIMVSVGLIGVLAVMNMTMFSENMTAQKSATEQAAATRVFKTMMGLLGDSNICTRFLGPTNPDFGNGHELPGDFVSTANNPRIEVDDERVIRMLGSDTMVMYKDISSSNTDGSFVYENKLNIQAMYMESFRGRNADGDNDHTNDAMSVKFLVLFGSSTAGNYTANTTQTYVQEGILNVTLEQAAPAGGPPYTIATCNAAL
ncbi:MAG: type II secretion system protein [Bdellovibrionales bacterium]